MNTGGVSPGAVTAPAADVIPGGTYAGTGAWQNGIATATITLYDGCQVNIWAFLNQGFPVGAKSWGVRIKADGTQVAIVSGPGSGPAQIPTAVLACAPTLSGSAGGSTHTITVDWYGQDSNITLDGGVLIVLGAQR